ncbi:MAG: hypothetical protein SVW57_05090 [Thermodesulfobacteriota bacterium]|nr:hypothetical protein [Thermodesulfobacteriota bacterium]
MNRLQSIIIVSIILFLLCGGSFYILFSGTKKNVHPPSEDLCFKINVLSENIMKEKQLLQTLTNKFCINYFSQNNFSSPKEASSFLYHKLKELANHEMVNLLNFQPLEKKAFSGYYIFPFYVEIEAEYSRIISFLGYLEVREGLFVDELKITSKAKLSRIHNCKFNVSSLEIDTSKLHTNEKKSFVRSSLSNFQKSLPKKWVAKRKIRRDPFSKPSPKLISLKKNTSKYGDSFEASQKISLLGIMSFPDHKVAIIDHQVVKKGDFIKNRQVISIENDQVILKEKQKFYILRLREEYSNGK